MRSVGACCRTASRIARVFALKKAAFAVIAPAVIEGSLVRRSRQAGVARWEPMQHRALAWALMIPFILFAVHGNFSFQGGDSSSRGFIGNVVLPGSAYAILLYLIFTNLSRVGMMALQMKLQTLLALLAVISVIWSQDPLRTATNGSFYLVDTLFAFYLVTKFEPRELMSLCMMCGALVGGAGLLIVFLLPQFGISHFARTDGAWQGIFVDRTTSAMASIFLISPAIVLREKAWGYARIAYVVLLLAFIFRAKAATAIIVFGTFLLALVIFRLLHRFARKYMAAVLVIGLPVAVVLIYVAPPYVAMLLGSFGRDLTLTGRTEIWQTLFRSVAKRPLLGYGYYAFWQGLAGESANVIIAARWYFGYAHNGLLEIILQLGFLGAAVFLGTLLQAVRNAWICFRGGQSVGTEWYASLILLTILYNIDEGTVVWPNQLLSILYVVACCGLDQAARQIKVARNQG